MAPSVGPWPVLVSTSEKDFLVGMIRLILGARYIPQSTYHTASVQQNIATQQPYGTIYLSWVPD
ncbi:hypothetical protein CsSME_00001391 [Camellia sinensis var. sinensis]